MPFRMLLESPYGVFNLLVALLAAVITCNHHAYIWGKVCCYTAVDDSS